MLILAGCAGLDQKPQGSESSLPPTRNSEREPQKSTDLASSPSQNFRDIVFQDIESVLFRGRPNWRAWGRSNLQTGDLVFTRGNHYILLGTINFTDLATTATGSEFSHVGMVAVIDDEPFVYDVSNDGVTKRPFDQYVTQPGFERVCTYRLKPSFYELLPDVLSYLHEQEQLATRFDRAFSPDNDALYCTELIVEAFRHAGQPIAEPQPIGELPGFDELNPILVSLAKRVTKLDDSSEIYCIGDQATGLMGSPMYEPFLASRPAHEPPTVRNN